MTDPSPFSALAAVAFPYLELAGLMVGVNLYLLHLLVPRPSHRPALDTMVLVVGLLVVSLGLWAAIGFAFVDPGDASTVAIFLAANSMMAVAGAWLVAVFLRAEERPIPARGWAWPAGVAGLLVGAEATMGCSFVLGLSCPPSYLAARAAG